MSNNKTDIEKPSFFRYAVLIAIVFCVCVISIGLIVVNTNNKKTGLEVLNEMQEEKKAQEDTVNSEEEANASSSIAGNNTEEAEGVVETSDEIAEQTQDELPQIDLANLDVEAEVEQIRSWYYSPTDSEEKFVLSKGTDGWNYSREYYFHEGVLYFVFAFNGTEEHRLYFKDGVMIRYIDENKNIYDYGNTSDFYDWESKVLSESKQFYE